ncbi:MAG TPA: hypothetical protein VNL91_04200 [Thermoanaerobaculia bacterium]|nr:hypothetical protein [Thermoanaerobaculia bacterium]
MPAQPQWYDAADLVQLSDAIVAVVGAGTVYGPDEIHLWNDLGGLLGADALRDAFIRPLVTNGSQLASEGFPILDEGWVQVAIVGQNSTGDSTMEFQTEAFTPIGGGRVLQLKDIPRNCARHIEVKIVPPANASNTASTVHLELVWDQGSIVLPVHLTTVSGQGVIPAWINQSARVLRRGRELSASGSAVVTIAKGSFAYDGAFENVPQETKTFNLTAADGALGVGQIYRARLSQKSDRTVTVTKSNKGADPAKPAVPAGEINLGTVTVAYQGGGTPVINPSDLDVSDVSYSEFLVLAGSGLTCRVAAGEAFSSAGTKPFSGAFATLNLVDNATNRIWLYRDGTFAVTQSDTVPSVGAQKLAHVVTAAGVITSIDHTPKTWIAAAVNEERIILLLAGDLDQTITQAAIGILFADAMLEYVDFEIGSPGVGAASGAWKVDVKYWQPGASIATAPTTIYTSSGTQDYRPQIAYNAASLRSVDNNDHEVVSFKRGTRFTVDLVAVPGGTFSDAPKHGFVVLRFRRR